MKRKLFLLLCAMLTMIGVQAQTDVTSTYLTNADFSSSTPIDNHLCGYGKDMTAQGTTYYGLQDVTGWTKVVTAGVKDDGGYENSGMGGAVFAYGSEWQMKGNNKTAPSADPNGNAGNSLGFFGVWGCGGYYYQEVTFPAGEYTINVPMYSASGTQANTSWTGFVTDDNVKYTVAVNPTVEQWTTQTVTFALFKETKGKICLGYQSTGSGSGANPHIFIDKVQILYSNSYTNYPYDMTGFIVNPTIVGGVTGWTCERPKGGGGPELPAGGALEYWAGSANPRADAAFDYYQTITNLPAGKYTVSAEMYNSLNGESGATFSTSSGVYATTSGKTVSNLVNVDGTTLTKYTTEEINVLDGTLRIGVKNMSQMGARWFVADNFTLTMTAAPDLSDYVAAYEQALGAAQAVDQSAKMGTSVLSSLQAAISTYAKGNVDETSISALTNATNALNTATANANTSIASYAVIAAGSVPDNSLVGWTCENSNTFHINTWSTEGNPGNDPSGMVTPFIENWVGKGSLLGAGKVYYELAGLEPGEVYYAQALIRSYNEKDATAPNGPDFFVNDAVTSLSDAGTTFTYKGMSGIYATLGSQATVGEDGTLTLGVTIANNRNYNWVAFKSVKIQELSAAHAAAVAAAEALEGQIPTAAYNNLMDEIAGYSTVTIENIENINAAVATYSALKSPYAEFNALKTKAQELQAVANDNAEANSTLADAITAQSAAVEAATTAEAITTVTSTLKAAMTTYVGAANPVGDGAQFDCTFMLQDNDLTGYTSRIKLDSWFTDQTFGAQNSQTMTDNSSVANSTDNTKYAMYEYWSDASCATSGFTVYQKYNLPVGTYRMDALCMTGWGYHASQPEGARNVTFSAGDVDGTSITTATLEPATLDFVQKTAGEVKVGLKAQAGNTTNWMGIGYIELYKVPAKNYAVSENAAWDNTTSGAGNVTLTRTIKAGINTLVLPFSMTQAEVEDKFGEGSKVYVVSSYDSENENISFITQEGILPNQPCLLKATVAGTSYELEGRTIVAGEPTYVLESVSMIGGYNATNSIPEDNYNYIISGNKIYFVDVAGVTMKGTRAYIKVASSNPAPAARELIMILDGEDPTAIDSIEVAEEGEDLKDGKYLIDGQIVIVKNGVKYSANGQILK